MINRCIGNFVVKGHTPNWEILLLMLKQIFTVFGQVLSSHLNKYILVHIYFIIIATQLVLGCLRNLLYQIIGNITLPKIKEQVRHIIKTVAFV